MGYTNLASCIKDLLHIKDLVIVDAEVDPDLEIAAIQRRVFKRGGPAVLFTKVKGTRFPMLGNLFGTKERIRFIFRDFFKRWDKVLKVVKDPKSLIKDPVSWYYLLKMGICIKPKVIQKDLGQFFGTCKISDLPSLRSWPMDGGGYITLPQVYSEDPEMGGFKKSNLGMYRIQLNGNNYIKDKEVGLHYQIHRGIASHHQKAIKRGEKFKVNIFVGGPPAMTFSAIMPLPDGMPEVYFASLMAGHRIKFLKSKGALPIPVYADFCITGHIEGKETKPEGPFGDHLGYYSLIHEFPVLKVEGVYCKKDAIWPFTTVGRPPQEDSIIGEVIHEIVAPFVSRVFSGVEEVHAVDAAGVHPLLLVIGRESYVPFEEERIPQEVITAGMSVLGSTQTSLSKYVFIAAKEDSPNLTTRDVPNFFKHIMERIDTTRDLHFITRTTMDTLDYSGISLNQGSKVIISVAGKKKRELASNINTSLSLPNGFYDPKIFYPGILILKGPPHNLSRDTHDPSIVELSSVLKGQDLMGICFIVIVDDVDFTVKNWDNFLWVTFTRSDPATDIYGVDSFTKCKYWGCMGPIIIDARLKKYHAPPLEEDPQIIERIKDLGKRGGPLYGLI
ncbi:UbiD family decarboxylase [Desulfothermus okinawensis JCM 13304]